MSSLLIKNGTIVTSMEEYQADVLINGEKISAIGNDLQADVEKIVDAHGMYILPGGVDQHTHFSHPFGGTFTRGFETTSAACIGGTTTIVDFVPQPPGMSLEESLDKHITENAKGISMVDYSFHSMVMDVTDKLFEEITVLPDFGVSTVKLFMAYKGTPFMINDATLFRSLQAAKNAGVTIMVHAENGDIIDYLQQHCVLNGNCEPNYHAVSRPPFVEIEATKRAIEIADMVNAPIFIVHVSCKEAMQAIRNANSRGKAVYGETCPHYLVLSVDNLSKSNFEGAKYVCSPALRTPDHHEALWESIQKGWLQIVGSDHCGFDWKEQKNMGREVFTKIPNGMPGVENRLAILWTYGVEKGKLSRQRLVDVYSTAPAKFNGLFPKKGNIGVGSDADIVIYNPNVRKVISVKDSLQDVDYSIFEGMKQVGVPEKVYLRGKLIVDNGKFIGEKGQGIFIKGEPYGAAYDGFNYL